MNAKDDDDDDEDATRYELCSKKRSDKGVLQEQETSKDLPSTTAVDIPGTNNTATFHWPSVCQ